jgi:MFS family permease
MNLKSIVLFLLGVQNMSETKQVSSKYLWSSCLGNLFEHYDTALFGFLSPFLAPLIFPQHDPLTALLLTYAIIPLGMLARPVGSIVFGYIGDTYGRNQALFISLAGMAVISGCIALSPTYAQAGIISPLIFCLGRILQNFFAAGEIMGGAIFLLEHTPEKKHDFLSSLYNASTIGGILIASAAVSLLGYFQAAESGWRVLYMLGCMTAIFGSMIRRQMDLVPHSSVKAPFSLISSLKIFWEYRRALLLIAVSSGFSYANYSIALVLLNGYIPLVTTFSKEDMLTLNTFLLVLDFGTLPLFGWLSSKVSREKLMIGTTFGVILTSLPFAILLQAASLATIIIIRICFVLFGVAFAAPFYAWAQHLVPSSYRYIIISFGYSVGSQLLGGPTSAVSLWLFKTTGMSTSICWYLMAVACVCAAMLINAVTKKKPIVLEPLA